MEWQSSNLQSTTATNFSSEVTENKSQPLRYSVRPLSAFYPSIQMLDQDEINNNMRNSQAFSRIMRPRTELLRPFSAPSLFPLELQHQIELEEHIDESLRLGAQAGVPLEKLGFISYNDAKSFQFLPSTFSRNVIIKLPTSHCSLLEWVRQLSMVVSIQFSHTPSLACFRQCFLAKPLKRMKTTSGLSWPCVLQLLTLLPYTFAHTSCVWWQICGFATFVLSALNPFLTVIFPGLLTTVLILVSLLH